MIVKGIDVNGLDRPVLLDILGRIAVAGVLPHSVLLEAGVAQVVVSGGVSGGTQVLYTVPAGKTFYLTSFLLNMLNVTAGGSTLWLDVRNAVPVVQYSWRAVGQNGNYIHVPMAFAVPVSVQAGWSLAARSSSAADAVGVIITGYAL